MGLLIASTVLGRSVQTRGSTELRKARAKLSKFVVLALSLGLYLTPLLSYVYPVSVSRVVLLSLDCGKS